MCRSGHILATQLLEVPFFHPISDGSPFAGCDENGCDGVLLRRDMYYCWNLGAQITGNVIPGAMACSVAALPCASDDDCAMYGLGTCVTGPPTVYQIGPALPRGCWGRPPGLVDAAEDARSSRGKGSVVFTWKASSFNTTHFNVVGTSRGGEVLNTAPIFAKANDGSEQSYEIAIPNRRVRFHRAFVIQTVLSDGSVKETPVE